MKKIVISVNSFWNIKNFRLDLVKYLYKDYELHLILPSFEDNNDLSKYLNIHIIKFDSRETNIFKNILVFIQYFFLLKKIKPDIFLGFTMKSNLFGLSLFNKKTKIILNFTGLGSLFTNKKYKHYKKLILFILLFCKKKITYAIVQNKYDYKYFLRYKIFSNSQLKIIPGSGINISEFKPINNVKKKKTYNFLYLSRIQNEKGFNIFIESIELFNKYSEHNANFYLAGEYNQNDISIIKKIETLVSNHKNVNYLGFVKSPRNIFENIDVFVLPSLREGLSRSLLEAMSMKRLVIGSNKPGINCLIKDNITGFLCKNYNSIDFYQKFEHIYSLDQDQITEMTNNARNLIKNNYVNKIINNSYSEIIKSAL